MEQNIATPQPDWAALGWITHRQPTEADADYEGAVWLPRNIADPIEGDTTFVDYRTVALGQPWYSKDAPEMQDGEPAPAEPDRIASRRVVQIAGGDNWLVALCNDGTLLQRYPLAKGTWTEVPAIPQP
jgi:hypothetical protein